MQSLAIIGGGLAGGLAALALAAKTKGIPSYIVVPEGAPQCKLDAIETNGDGETNAVATTPARAATPPRCGCT